jgi:hypothetical protein
VRAQRVSQQVREVEVAGQKRPALILRISKDVRIGSATQSSLDHVNRIHPRDRKGMR